MSDYTAEDLFFREVPKKVTDTLDLRKAYYKANVRDSNAHAWLNKKMAYASAKAGKTTLGTVGGGFKDMYGTVGGTNADKGTRFVPRPHLDTVSISSKGDFGSLRDCKITFSCYSLNQLDNLKDFFTIGGNISVDYGWNAAGDAGGKPGKFTGKIYNFSYTLTNNGGFSCSTEAIGPGIAIFAGNANVSNRSTVSTVDSTGITIFADSIANILRYYQAQAATIAPGETNDNGIGVLSLPTDGSFKALEGSLAQQLNNTPVNHYISLSAITSIINGLTRKSAGLSQIQFLCNDTVTRFKKDTDPVTIPTVFASANPMEVIFPGYGNYPDSQGRIRLIDFTKSDYTTKFSGGDLSKCMLSINWLLETLNANKSKKTEKGTEYSIKDFLNSIFNCIYHNSGTLFKLATVSDPSNQLIYYVANVSYSEPFQNKKAYVITAVTDDSICRNASLTSKVPSEMAAPAMIAATSTLAPESRGVRSLALFGAEEDTVTQSDTISEATTAVNDAKAAFSAKTIEELDKSVEGLRSALTRLYTMLPPISKGESTIFPLDLSVTLDGIEGFEFGHYIKFNYMSNNYTHGRIAFTVTTVSHEISGNDWTTTLSTVSRLIPVQSRTGKVTKPLDIGKVTAQFSIPVNMQTRRSTQI